MTTQIRSWLDNAILQSVAESYLNLIDQIGIDRVLSQGVNHPILNANGTGATRLTETQITWFKANYEIITHYPNDDQSGFSATLFRNKTTNEYTLSFRSTEYQKQALGGDWELDGSSGGADASIRDTGLAFAQLSSMESFYAHLKNGEVYNTVTKTWVASLDPKVLAFNTGTPAMNVTGYSLGSHLSTAFTLQHWADVNKTYNYNAAGVGVSGAPASAGAAINNLVTLYNQMMAWNGVGTPAWWGQLPSGWVTSNLDYIAFQAAALVFPGTPTDANIYTNVKYQRVMDILKHASDISSGLWLGAQDVAASTAAWLFSFGYGPGGKDPNAFNSSLHIQSDWDAKITQVYGHGEFFDPQFVANSLYHASANSVWIEDLPMSRGVGFLELRRDIGITGGIPNAHLVSTIRVDGEFTSSAPISVFDPIGTPATLLDHGPYSNPSIDLHSQALLAAFLQSKQSAATSSNPTQTFSEVTKKLTDLLGMIFNGNLFAHPTNDKKFVNLLEHLVRHEAGVQGSFAADAMVTRFTSDLWKIAQDGGLTLRDGNPIIADLNFVSKALTAFAMQKYYEETNTSPAYNKELFSAVTGGIQFDRLDVAATLDQAKGYNLYFSNYLNNAFTAEERNLINALLPALRDWYVQAGAVGMNATDTLNQGAFMLGGAGNDGLRGGTSADLLVGNAGDDLLMGSQGNDTYVYQTGDGLDTIYDDGGQGSIVYDSVTLNGGAQYGDARVHRDASKHLYVQVDDKTLLIDGNIIVNGYTASSSILGLTMAGAVADVNPITILPKIIGDLAPKDADPVALGIQYSYDTLGNVEVLATAEPNRADTLFDSTGNDHIVSGGGNDIINAYQGGNDLIEAGAGRDSVQGGAGKDVISGGADGDILDGGLGDDRLYADTQITVAQAIANGNSESGSGFSGGAANDYNYGLERRAA